MTMKKISIVFILISSSLQIFAQLKVDTVGRVNIGTNLYNNDANLFVKGNLKYGIRCDINSNVESGSGFYNSYQSQGTNDASGIYCTSYGPNVDSSHKIIGIRGMARTQSSGVGLPISIFGHLSSVTPSTRGIAVLGSKTLNFNESWVSERFAGYFYGLTKVQGDFIVTGNIQGTLLGNSAPEASNSEYNLNRQQHLIINNLKHLTPRSFTHEISAEIEEALGVTHDFRHIRSSDNNQLQDDDKSEFEKELCLDNENAILELSTIEKQILTKQHYGINAEELEEVFPDLVYENEDGTKSINYVEMVPILVQAINELKGELDELKGNGGEVKKAPTRTASSDEMGENVTLLALGQNKPNPFGTSTNIEVSIPADVQKAFIYVYDLTGKKLQQIDIPARGNQAVTVNASSLTDGMYLYSLIADGKVVETRRMIVEK